MLTGFAIGDRGLGISGDTHPDWIMAHAEIGSYLAVGASAVGQIHLAKKLPRDDAFAIRSVGPWLAVAVADGVGSRPLSRYGAAYVVESLTHLLLRKLASPIKLVEDKLLTEGAAISSSVPEDADLKYLAPPPTLDQFEFKPWIEEANTENRVQLSSSQDKPAQQLRQVGSLSWWLTSDAEPAFQTKVDQELPASARQFKAPLPDTEQEQGTDESDTAALQVSADEYNLREIMTHAFTNTHLGLREQAAYLGLELNDVSCTALALLLNVESGVLALGQIGDGAILGLPAEGKVEELVHAVDTGDPQSTYTLNRPNFAKYLAINVIEPLPNNPFQAFYVMTDGLSGDLLYSPHPVDNWAKSVKENLQRSSSSASASAAMLNWLSTYQVKGSWDDRTLVVILQRERSDGNSQPVTGQSQPAQPDGNH